MLLKDVNCEVERLNNKLDKLLKDKELLETIIDPKSSDYTKLRVDGGKHQQSIQEVYVLKEELPRWKDLDKRIQKTQEEITNNLDWIDKELKILKKYRKVEQLIVYYKEDSPKQYTWLQISMMEGIHLSERQCKRIYKRYKDTRNIL